MLQIQQKTQQLATAVGYFNKQWPEMLAFLEDSHVELTNNVAERAIKPFTICRRNFLFSKTNNEATAFAVIFSMIQTAKANGLVPETYLTYVLNNINEPLNNLLPWSEKLQDEVKSVF